MRLVTRDRTASLYVPARVGLLLAAPIYSSFYSPVIPLHYARPLQSIAGTPRSSKQLFWRAMVLALLASAGLIAVAGTTESLWVDELHTSWCVSGDWSAVAPRAAVGNQSPLYFWMLSGWRWTLGAFQPLVGTEFLLRLPSVLCWLAAIWLLLTTLKFHWWQQRIGPLAPGFLLTLPAATAWILCDRIQLFYATEARVYALVQLFNLAGWLLLARVLCEPRREDVDSAAAARQLVAWGVLGALLVQLHVTAGLALLWQCLVGTVGVLFLSHVRRLRRLWAGLLAAVGLSTLAALASARTPWEERARWASFAGEATLETFFALFPLFPLLVPVLWMRSQDLLLGPLREEPTGRASPTLLTCRSLWLCAAFGPWLTAWLLTALDIVPLFHRRFVIASALPLVVLAIGELVRIRRAPLQLAAVVMVIAALIVSQGTWQVWRQGQLLGWQRLEGWREAVGWVEGEVRDGDQVWCAAGLIEGSSVDLPLSDRQNVYLSFPLRGDYRIHSSQGRVIEPRALVNDARKWAAQFSSALTDQTEQRLWFFYRGTPARLQQRLRQVEQSLAREELSIESPEIAGFGSISVARLTLSPSSKKAAGSGRAPGS